MTARLALLVPFCLSALTLFARAQEPLVPTWQYAAKVVCGKGDGKVVAPGAYFTAVNVHNPSDAPVAFRFKIATAPGLEGGQITPFFEAALQADQALEVDCPDLVKRARARDFLKGFLVLVSPSELDVVGVYTAAGSTGQIEALDLERVPARRHSGCTGPDLVVEAIEDPPVWDGANHRSVIRATIKNIGNAPAPTSLARVIDPSTPQPTGAPYNDVQPTPALAPGASATVTFYLPYWVFNPDADLEITADYKNTVKECREDNNVRTYHRVG